MNDQRISLTCAPGGENHRGNQLIGKPPIKGSGLTYSDLRGLETWFKYEGNYEDIELIDLNKESKIDNDYFIIIRNYAKNYTKNIYEECMADEWDSKYLDPNKHPDLLDENGKPVIDPNDPKGKRILRDKTKHGRVLNKHARKNICYVKGVTQEPDYQKGKGRIVDLNSKENLNLIVENLLNEINTGLKFIESKSRVEINVVEGNHYYNLKKTGIGFHGDTERVVVICITIGGGGNYPMRWSWFINGKPIGLPINVGLNDGDLYIMSEKAVGADWKKRSIYTLRHAAGCDKYLNMKKWKKEPMNQLKQNSKKNKPEKTKEMKLQIKKINKEGIEINIGIISDQNLAELKITENNLGKKICEYENYNINLNGKLIKSGIYYLNK
jgi:hypothetical protein